MGNLLSPTEAARLALAVYDVRTEGGLPQDKSDRSQLTGLGKIEREGGGFDAVHSFMASSGYDDVHTPTLAIQRFLVEKARKTPTEFGYFAIGEGRASDQAIIATRGTDILPDVLTDLWAKPSASVMGSSAHSGFVDTHRTYHSDLKHFANAIKRTVNTVHCVGHSLGGALATLNAEYLCRQGFNVNLYTFGSPRVGYGCDLKNALRQGKVTIQRVYHDGDPVPMVPCWPFVHTEGGFCIGRQTLIGPAAHRMKESYLAGSKRAGSWRGIARSTDPIAHKDLGFFESAIKYGVAGSASLLNAILYLLKKLIRTAEVLVGVTFIATLSLLDFLAWLVVKAAKLTVEFGRMLTKVIGGIMRFIGHRMVEGANLTEYFVRYIFQRFFTLISNQSVLALMATLSTSPAVAVAGLPATIPFAIV